MYYVYSVYGMCILQVARNGTLLNSVKLNILIDFSLQFKTAIAFAIITFLLQYFFNVSF
jgi:hypothetical protein